MGIGIGMNFGYTPDAQKSLQEARLIGQQYFNSQSSDARKASLARTFGLTNPNGYLNAGLMNQWAHAALPDQDYVGVLRSMGLSPDQLAANYKPLPINTGPIWSDQQIQDQVNALKASSAQRADTDSRTNASRLSSQGYGQGSPLEYALRASIDANRMASDSDAERTARWDAATGNANFQQQGQIAAARAQNDFLNALLSSQAQLMNMFQSNNQARANLLSNALGQIFS